MRLMNRQEKLRSVSMAVATLVIAALLAAPGRAQSPAVGWWTFDNASNLGEDSSASGNNLTNNGDVAHSAGGAPAALTHSTGVLLLDGDGDMLTGSPFPAVPTGDDPFSISAWIKIPVGQIGNRGIVGWGRYDGPGAGPENRQTNGFRVRDPNNIRNYWWARDLGADAATGGTGIDLDDNTWHHAVVTYDQTTRALWVDDNLVGSDMPDDHLKTAANFAIGRTCCSEFWLGELDDVAIFDYALSNNDINPLFTGANTPGNLPEPSTGLLFVMALASLAAARGGRTKR